MNKVWKYIVQAMQIGYEIFGTLLIMVVLGLVVDKYFHTKPIGILAGSILGIVTCFMNILKLGRD